MKFICLHPRLGDYTSHHYNESHGFMRELARRGRKFVLLANAHAPAKIARELKARAVLDDPTFRMEWSFDERSRRFLEMLHAQVDSLVRRGDCVMLTVSTQLEAHALTRWLEELPPGKKPWIVVYFISDRWNRKGRDEYERQVAEFEKLRATVAALTPQDRHRMVFCAITDLLARELEDLLGTSVDVAPVPMEYGDPAPRRTDGTTLPRVAILGGTRREKGSSLLPGIIRETRAHVRAEFLVQLTNNTLTASEAEELAAIATEPDVSVIREAMSLRDYNAALSGADLALFPYEVVPYTKRLSGVFCEAVAYGKPAVVTPGTWLAAQITGGRAAGVIAEDARAESFGKAIARCIGELEPLRLEAASLAPEWRRTFCLSAFVDYMESEIARRASSEEPQRKPFWRFW